MANDTCATSDGNAMCSLPNADGTRACGCNPARAENEFTVPMIETPRTESKLQIRSIGAFVVACVASPCCTPLYVPLLLIFFAGTPFAVWLGQNMGWVYAALTLISISSFVLALRWRQIKVRQAHHFQKTIILSAHERETTHA